jgi:hypothetical protein
MSEYQCYEFVALDRPLTSKQMTELRAISTRAEISPTPFWNEYEWGDLKADPEKLQMATGGQSTSRELSHAAARPPPHNRVAQPRS